MIQPYSAHNTNIIENVTLYNNVNLGRLIYLQLYNFLECHCIPFGQFGPRK